VKLAEVEANAFEVVPEPGALSLIGLSAVGLFGRRPGPRAVHRPRIGTAWLLFVDFPSHMFVGERATVTVIVRNEGDLQWPANQSFNFGQQDFQPGEVRLIDQPNWRDFIVASENEVSTYGGIFRGRPVKFEFDLVAPAAAAPTRRTGGW
jgi:hypothetical protein